jgi:hypothetical protein
MNGVPEARAVLGALAHRPLLGLDELERQHERQRQRRAGRERGDLAQHRPVRFAREVHADARRGDDCGTLRVEAHAFERGPPRRARLEVDRHEAQPIRNRKAELDEALPLPRLRARLIDLEHAEPRRELGPSLREGVEPRPEEHVLIDAAVLFVDEIFDGSERARRSTRVPGSFRAGPCPDAHANSRREPPIATRRRRRIQAAENRSPREARATTQRAPRWNQASRSRSSTEEYRSIRLIFDSSQLCRVIGAQ